MTITAIVKEIRKRIEQLDAKYYEAYERMIMYKVRGDTSGMDKEIAMRRTIAAEREKLWAMITAYERNF